MAEVATTGTSPVPPATTQAQASAQAQASPAFFIGKSFIKQYYEVLATCPENIPRFYKPESSIISHSFQPSVPAEPKTLTGPPASTESGTDSTAAFFKWAAKTSKSGSGISVDFGSGAIDAQESIGGGILLVVTGQMTLPTPDSDVDVHNADSDGNNTENIVGPRPFVHTFFLSNSAAAGKKKNFYVHNDILRFISTSASTSTSTAPTSSLPKSSSSSSTAPTISTTTSASTVIPLADNEEQNDTAKASTKTVDADVSDNATPPPQDKPSKQTNKTETEVTSSRAPPQAVPSKVVNGKDKVKATEKEGSDVASEVAAPSAPSSKKEENKSEKSKQKKNKQEPTSEKNDSSSSNNNNSNSKGNKKNAKESSSSDAKSNKTDKKKNDANNNSNNNNSNTTSEPTNTKEEKKSKKNKARSRSRKKGRSGSRSASPTDDAGGKSNGKSGKNDDVSSSKPKTPGSWASLVAGTSGSSKPSPAAAAAASAASQMTEASAKVDGNTSGNDNGNGSANASSKETSDKTKSSSTSNDNESNSNTKESKSSSSKSNSNSNAPPTSSAPQRTPEATLFLKNIPDRAKEAEIRSMFEPYALLLNQKILGITLKASSGFCFVDFDAKVVVDTILKEVGEMKKANANTKQQDGNNGNKKTDENKFILHGKMLDVGRKVPVEKSGGNRGHSYRSSSPGNNAFPKSRHHRRNSPRGGNRSGRQHGHGNQEKK